MPVLPLTERDPETRKVPIRSQDLDPSHPQDAKRRPNTFVESDQMVGFHGPTDRYLIDLLISARLL
jgi:hypothetical protein